MQKRILDETFFWEWMTTNFTLESGGIYDYLLLISDNIIDKGFIVELSNQNFPESPSSIMKTLKQYVPHRYFLEIQYCANVYATLFGRIFPPLASYVDQLAYIEWLLYTEPGYTSYRDHLVHMFKVAFVADQVLSVETLHEKATEWQFSSKHFLDWCRSCQIHAHRWNTTKQKNVFLMASFLAALFHDFGYGYFFLRKYKQRLFQLYQWLLPGADPTDIDTFRTKVLIQSLPSFFIKENHIWLTQKKSGITDNIIAGFYRDCLPLNHSLASTFFVIDIAEKLRNSKALTQELYVAFQLAAEACMIHDMTKDGTWAHLRKKKNEHFLECNDHKKIPLAMLLILADELSIWDRPILKMKEKGKNSILHCLDKSKVPKSIEIKITERAKNNIININPDRAHSKIINAFHEELACLKNKIDQNAYPRLLGYRINVSSPKKTAEDI
jgi:hypothetical protein